MQSILEKVPWLLHGETIYFLKQTCKKRADRSSLRKGVVLDWQKGWISSFIQLSAQERISLILESMEVRVAKLTIAHLLRMNIQLHWFCFFTKLNKNLLSLPSLQHTACRQGRIFHRYILINYISCLKRTIFEDFFFSKN